MKFEEVIPALREGKSVRRKWWNTLTAPSSGNKKSAGGFQAGPHGSFAWVWTSCGELVNMDVIFEAFNSNDNDWEVVEPKKDTSQSYPQYYPPKLGETLRFYPSEGSVGIIICTQIIKQITRGALVDGIVIRPNKRPYFDHAYWAGDSTGEIRNIWDHFPDHDYLTPDHF